MDESLEVQPSSTTEPTVNVDELVKKVATLEAINKQLFERAKKAEEAKKLPDNEEVKPHVQSNEQGFKDIEDRVELRMQNYEPEEISEIAVFAKAKGISITEAAKAPFIQAAISSLRAEKKSKDNTPSPSNRGIVYNGKPVKEVLTSDSSTKEDKQAAFEALKNARLKGNKNE